MTSQQGLALPMVAVVCCLCSVLLLSEWRSLTLAQGMGQSAALRWQLKHDALDALRLAVEDIRLNTNDARHQMGAASDKQVFYPHTLQEWQTLQMRLKPNECQEGICPPLGLDHAALAPWLKRLPQAQAVTASSGNRLNYWVEIFQAASYAENQVPFLYRISVVAHSGTSDAHTGLQAVWQPNPAHADSLASPLPTTGLLRLLMLSP
jgi:hypothetical protein